jgi:hypothetical protein
VLNPPSVALVDEQIEKVGRPTLVVLDMATRMMDQDLVVNPNNQKLTELQKGQIALKYV